MNWQQPLLLLIVPLLAACSAQASPLSATTYSPTGTRLPLNTPELESSETRPPTSTSIPDPSATALPTPISLHYTLTIPDSNQSRAIITGSLTGINDRQLILARPFASLPVLPTISLFTINDHDGIPLIYTFIESGESQNGDQKYLIEIAEKTSVTFEYEIDLTTITGDYGFGEFGYWYFKPDDYFMVESQILFMQPTSIMPDEVTVEFDLPTDWQVVSRFEDTDEGIYKTNIRDVTYYGNHHDAYIIWGPLGLGKSDVYSENIGGIEFVVAIPLDNQDIGSKVAHQRFVVIRYISEHLWSLGKDSFSRYINIYPAPDPLVIVSARDHSYGDFGFVVLEDVDNDFIDNTHSSFHQWFVHDGLEFSNWDVLYPDMWAEEGLNDYFALRTNYHAGLATQEQFYNELIKFYMRYRDDLLGTSYDVALTGQWDMPIEKTRTLWYKKGALVNFLLDEKVQELTNDTKSIEDVYQYLHNNLSSSDHNRITADDMLVAYNEVTGNDFSDLFEKYIHGNDPLPLGVLNGGIHPVWDSQFPHVTALAKPDSGSVPLAITFDGVVEDEGQIMTYEWDFNGDKIYDWWSSTTPNITYTYVAGDEFTATLRVTDYEGLISQDSLKITISGPTLPQLAVTADGNPSEWVNIPLFVTDPEGDTEGFSSDIAGLSISQDGEFLCFMLSFHDMYEANNRINSFHIRDTSEKHGYQIRVAELGSPLLQMWRETESGVIDADASRLIGGVGEVVELKIPLDAIESPDEIELFAMIGTIDYVWYDQTGEIVVTISTE